MFEWLKQLFGRVTGSTPAKKPGSPGGSVEPGNGVSSFHLWWQGVDGGLPLVEVAATFEVLHAPTANRLYFWALQASFLDGKRSLRRGPHRAAVEPKASGVEGRQLGRLRRHRQRPVGAPRLAVAAAEQAERSQHPRLPVEGAGGLPPADQQGPAGVAGRDHRPVDGRRAAHPRPVRRRRPAWAASRCGPRCSRPATTPRRRCAGRPSRPVTAPGWCTGRSRCA